MTHHELEIETADYVRTITLSREKKLNALTPEMIVDLAHELAEAERDDSVRVIVLTHKGRGFCTGVDVGTIKEKTQGNAGPGTARARARSGSGVLINQLLSLEKPTVARVDGVCAGAGISLAVSCDFVYATDSARFVFSFVQRGLVPDYGLTHFLPRLVGVRAARELCLSGSTVSAPEADRLGLISASVAPDRLDQVVADRCRSLVEGPGVALRLTKRLLNDNTESMSKAIDAEFTAQALCLATNDAAEGASAFLERRSPRFTWT